MRGWHSASRMRLESDIRVSTGLVRRVGRPRFFLAGILCLELMVLMDLGMKDAVCMRVCGKVASVVFTVNYFTS